MKIYITAIIKAHTVHQEEVRAFLLYLVQETRKEEACIRYDLHLDQTDLNTFIFYEIWKDQEGLDLHNQQPYIKQFGQLANSALQEAPTLYITTKI